MMLQNVARTIARYRMIAPGERVAVACSGGPDSTALLLALQELAPKLGCTLSVCHFNHRLRGEQSQEDQRFVRSLAERLGIAFDCARADVRGSAAKARANLESKARELRYRFFRSLIEAGKADRIGVGHTADDQAETVLHRFLRGSGTRGLAGIYPVAGAGIVRPLIEVRRQAVVQWLQVRGQSWREDESNRDVRLTRNRIRHELLPMLSAYNPRIVETLAGTGVIARDEESYWELLLPTVLPGVAHAEAGRVVLEIGALRELQPAVIRRVLRWALGAAAHGKREPAKSGNKTGKARTAAPRGEFEEIERLLRLVNEGRSGNSVELAGKLLAIREYSRLVVQPAGSTRAPQGYSRSFRVPATVEVPEIGSTFSFELVPVGQGKARYNGIRAALLDKRLAEFPLTLRNWHPGDGYKPKGHQRQRKLKELFQKGRISRSERQGWPVVVAGDQVVWMRDFEVPEELSPAPGKRLAMLIHESKKESK
jgi:tRNA(Ile)-lysidine synthase